MDPAVIDAMIGRAPGAVRVSYGGVDGWGHDAHIAAEFSDGPGALVSMPSVVVADGYFPEIGLDRGSGSATGIDVPITVGDYMWSVRAIEPAMAAGEIRVLLSNRRAP